MPEILEHTSAGNTKGLEAVRQGLKHNPAQLLGDGIKGALRIGQTAMVLSRQGARWLGGDRPPTPRLMRETFEALGATYIKLGQFIASSPTFFPREYVDEFQDCLDQTRVLIRPAPCPMP